MITKRSAITRSLTVAVSATAIIAAGCAGMSGPRPIRLSGSQEVPPVITAASGVSDLSVREFKCPAATSSDNCPTVFGSVTTSGINATSAEIRDGAVGQPGPVVAKLVRDSINGNVWEVPPDTTLTAAQYADYRAGRLYVSVDSNTYRSGEIRAQLKP